jgi:hypothetical protein
VSAFSPAKKDPAVQQTEYEEANPTPLQSVHYWNPSPDFSINPG